MKTFYWIGLLLLACVIIAVPIIAHVWYGSGDDTGLVGHWACEGNFKDSSGQGNNGTQSGGVTITSGVKGRGCGFDGVNDYVTIPASQDFNTSQISISAWIKGPTSNINGAIIDINYYNKIPSIQGFDMRVLSFDPERFYCGNGNGTGSNEDYTTYSFQADTWYNIGCTYDGINNKTWYVNGVPIYSKIVSSPGPIAYQNNDVTIGRRLTSSYAYFNGTIDEVRVYNRSLSEAEVASLYDSQKSYKIVLKTTPTQGLIDETGLVFKMSMNAQDGCNSTWCKDLSGLGNNGTVSGATFTNEGRFKEGYKMNGIQYINLANPTSLNLSVGTVSMWVKPITSFSGDTGVQKHLMKGGPSYYYYSGITSRLMYYLSDGTTSVYSNSGSWDTKWYHAVVTHNGTFTAMYIDGVQQTATTTSSGKNLFAFNGAVLIGSSNFNVNHYMDEVRIYNRSLSATEVANLYNGSKSNYISIKTTPTQGLTTDLTDYPYLTNEAGLVGWWKLNGDATDSSGMGNNGIITNAASTSSGRWSSAYNFNASPTQFINISSSDDWLFGKNNFSISLWLKASSTQIDNYPALIRGTGNTGASNLFNVFIHQVSDDHLRGQFYDSSGNATGDNDWTSTDVSDDTWHHFVIVVDRNTPNILTYLDTTVKDTAHNIAGFDDFNFTNIYIGTTSTTEINSIVDEVRIYNRSLSAAEVQELYLSRGLVGYWKMDASVSNTTTTRDLSGYNNHGTILGAVLTNEGRFKEGFELDGINDLIYGYNTNINWTQTNKGTLSLWVKPLIKGGAETYPYIFDMGGSQNTAPFRIYTRNALSTINFRSYNTTGGFAEYVYSGTILQSGWTHLAMAHNGTHVTSYINGAAVNTTEFGGLMANPTSGLCTFGRVAYVGADYLNGTIDEVRIYNRALSDSEVAGLYNGTKSNKISFKQVPG